MICIVGTRGSGKTRKLIEMSEATGIPICTSTAFSAQCVKDWAKYNGNEIPEPIVGFHPTTSQGTWADMRVKRTKDGFVPVLIDDYERFFNDIGLFPEVITINAERVDLSHEIGMKPTLINCLRVWLRARKEKSWKNCSPENKISEEPSVR